jgi:hypothetical protein
MHKEEQQRLQDQVKIELGRILSRQKELEENNERFMRKDSEIKHELKNIEISDEEYEILSKKNEDYLSIRDFVCVCVLFIRRMFSMKPPKPTGYF